VQSTVVARSSSKRRVTKKHSLTTSPPTSPPRRQAPGIDDGRPASSKSRSVWRVCCMDEDTTGPYRPAQTPPPPPTSPHPPHPPHRVPDVNGLKQPDGRPSSAGGQEDAATEMNGGVREAGRHRAQRSPSHRGPSSTRKKFLPGIGQVVG